MHLSDIALEKADPALQKALAYADATAPMRVIVTLGDPDPAGAGPDIPKTPGPFRRTKAGSPAGPVSRRTLIESRRRCLESSYGPLRKTLAATGLRVSGGELTRALVLEGEAENIAAALTLPLVRRAMLDQRIGNPPVIRQGVPRIAPTGTAGARPAKPAKKLAGRVSRKRRRGALAKKRS